MNAEMLRRLSESDLQAIAAGTLDKVSDQGLQMLAGASAAAEEPKRKSTEGMGLGTRILANVGAGMADLGLGVRQLYTDLTGTDEDKAKVRQEVEDKRRLDAQLAEDSFDMPLGKYAAKGLQIAGNVAPTLVLPAGGAVQSGRLLPLALRSAATGAGLSAINPVGEDENRLTNMALGAGLSAAAPIAGAGINQVRRISTRAGGAERAGEQIAREVAEGATNKAAQRRALQQTLDRLQTARGQQGNIPLSTAAQLSDPQLARLEAGSRARNGANWYDFDQTQARSVSDELMRATSAADDLAARRALRSRNYDAARTQAMSSVNEGAFVNDLGRFRTNLDQAMLSSESSNPAVRNMLKAIADDIDRVTAAGMQYTPDHLATIRANLSGRQNPLDPNVFKAAPRDAPATVSVLQEVDNILNNATNNRWQGAVRSYARDSDAVRAAQAAGKVRGSFFDQETGRVLGVAADAAGDVPKITEAGLGRAMNAARGTDKSLVLSPEANRRLEDILGALRKQNIVQGVKRSATAGGGSNTASDTMAARAAGDAADAIMGAATGPAAPVARGVMTTIRSAADARKDEALAAALQNPDRMIEIIEAQLRRGEPLTPQMEYFLRVASGAPAATLSTME